MPILTKHRHPKTARLQPVSLTSTIIGDYFLKPTSHLLFCRQSVCWFPPPLKLIPTIVHEQFKLFSLSYFNFSSEERNLYVYASVSPRHFHAVEGIALATRKIRTRPSTTCGCCQREDRLNSQNTDARRGRTE